MIKLSTSPPRGFRDFYPEDLAVSRRIEEKVRGVLRSYGYVEYDGPTLEETALYRAKSGNELADEQAYCFTDKGGREMTMRPEMTPTLARMVAARRGELSFPIRWFSLPTCYRYERPQRGRVREFRQWNVDLVGSARNFSDVEMLELAAAILGAFGATKTDFRIHVNFRQHIESFLASLADGEARDALRKLLDSKRKVSEADFVAKSEELLPDEMKRLLWLKWCTLPALPPAAAARVLAELAENDNFLAPQRENFREMAAFFRGIETTSVADVVAFDGSIVRGLGYYTGIVFEVFDQSPENPRALFGGGRYDGLVGIFGGENIPAIGFGVSDTSLWNFLETHGLLPAADPAGDVELGAVESEFLPVAKAFAAQLRAAGLRVSVIPESAKPDKILKHADKSGFRFAAVVGAREAETGTFEVKDLRSGKKMSGTPAEVIARIGG